MILYLDTSSLVKLYVEESHSESVRQWVAEAELVATCRVAYPETLSALTRRCRNGDLSPRRISTCWYSAYRRMGKLCGNRSR